MATRIRRWLVIGFGLLVIGIVLTILLITTKAPSEVIAQEFPPTLEPRRLSTPILESLADFEAFNGRGPNQAPLALEAALPVLPFRARTPTYLPAGIRLYNVGSQLIGSDKRFGNLDLYYIGAGEDSHRIDLHLYQTNQLIEQSSPDEARKHWIQVKAINIAGSSWTYRLLSYPQPDGTTFQLHEVDRTLDDGVYLQADIRVGANAGATFSELVKVVSSLSDSR